MRRFFALFLLLLLPLQFAFAAAAPYCAFEKVKVASHFAHHEHPDSPAPKAVDDRSDQWEFDDCEMCHLGHGKVPATAESPFVMPVVLPVIALPDDRQPQHLQEPIDRPPRPSLA